MAIISALERKLENSAGRLKRNPGARNNINFQFYYFNSYIQIKNLIVKKTVIALMLLSISTTNYAEMRPEKNPLLTRFETPYQTAPFDHIKPEHFEPAVKKTISIARKEFKQLISNKEEPTFQNTFLPVEVRFDEISRIVSILFNLNSAETNSEIQAVTQKVSPMLTRFMGQLILNSDYFERVSTVYGNREKSGLNPEEIRLVETTYQTMKRNGANLDKAKKAKLILLQMKLSKLSLKFKDNVLAETNKFELHLTQESDLAGLPQSVIDAAAQTAKSKNKEGWVFTLQFPSFGPFMKYSDQRVLREKMYRANSSKCNTDTENDNSNNITEIVNLRLKQANMLGYDNYAQYVLEERMAETPAKVNALIQELHIASKPFAQNEITELKEFARSKGFNDEFMPWDFSYYSEKLKSEKFGFNEEMVKPYFNLDKVIDGVFNLASTLYGITFKEVNNIAKYNPEVKTYEVFDESGTFLSILYADFHPRESKQGGAWMTEYRAQSNIGGEMIRPHISICGNFTKPLGDKPALLTFNEVNTFLHEFGHALHGMLANTVYPSLSGTNVYRDFVELPSQIMENYATEIEWLKTFAFHYETGEPMPAALVQKLIDARNFQSGYQSERQLSFGIADMAWHSLNQPFKGDIVSFERNAISDTKLFPDVDGSLLSTSFSHIFGGGYAAGYYSYKWAEVLDADAFSYFQEKGIFNKTVAEKFRKNILEKGGTAHPMELYKNFRGEEPTIDALLKRSGLN
jgi:peptidyl-dipeptidase Dcp